jgi:hypothetical protein
MQDVKAIPPGEASSPFSPVRHLDQTALARRWNISPRTLERWRWLGIGPRYLKIGGHVVYRSEDILAFETAQARGGAA